MKWFKVFISIIPVLVIIWAGNTSFSGIPPIGKFFDPFHGFWNNGESDYNKEETLSLPGLQSKVTVLWDERSIPHVFAKNDHDLYLAQGYLTAKDRLWQMDITSRVAAGRLSEVVGKRRLNLDIENRSIGLLRSATNAIAELDKHPEIKDILDAYCKGANLYIQSLSYARYPIEYKILDYKPESWTPVKILLIHKYMSKTLSYRSSDREMNNIRNLFDRATLDDLFPLKDSSSSIIPDEKTWDFTPVSPDTDKSASHTNQTRDVIFPNTAKLHKGSNNWAVSGQKTASGKPMLANDPHLRLSMPSIWYESQLVNDNVNVYGVTIPGMPGIIIGFNQNIAWGVTNQLWDTVDWYEVTFQDEKRDHYKFDGKWRKTSRVKEVIKVKGAPDHELDLVYTHYGPVVTSTPSQSLALRWVAHDPSLEFKTFHLLNRAKNYDDYRAALKFYACPAQNFAFASVDGDIAMSPSGKLPIKPEGFGRMIEDGSSSKTQWRNYVPFDHLPFIKNPKINYISSANQHPTNKSYPYYYNGRYEYYRNVRINDQLAKMKNVTVDTFNLLLNDNYNLHASTILPTMLKMVDKKSLSPIHQKQLDVVVNWDYLNNADKIAPSVFEVWWNKTMVAIWDEFADRKKFKRPSWNRTVNLILKEPNSQWMDNVSTKDKKETIEELVNACLISTLQELTKKYKPMYLDNGKVNPKWLWGRHKGSHIFHNLFLPSLSKLGLNVGGGRHIVNATSRQAGPSWRMVVEMTTPIKAWGVYPGGQSGHPGSKYYDNFIDHWSKGKLYQLHYLTSDQQLANITRKSVMEAK